MIRILAIIKDIIAKLSKAAVKYWRITVGLIAAVFVFLVGRKSVSQKHDSAEEAKLLSEKNKKDAIETIKIVEDHVDKRKQIDEKFKQDSKRLKEKSKELEVDLKENVDKIDGILREKFNLHKGN